MKKLFIILCVHFLFMNVYGQIKSSYSKQASASAGIDPAAYSSKGINSKYSFTNKWLYSQILGNYSSATGLLGASGTVRGMAVLNGKMMFPDRANKQIIIVDGQTGLRDNPLQLASDIFTYTGRNKANTADSVWTAGTLTHNDLKVDNAGNVLISNLIISNTGRFQVWKINMTTGTGTIVIDQADLVNLFPTAATMRFDAFGVTGDVNSNATIMAVNANAMAVYKWSIVSGIAGTPTMITLKNNIWGTDFHNLSNLGTAPQVFPLNDNTFYVDGNATNPVLVDGTGTPLGGFIETSFPNYFNVKGHNGVVEFNMGGENFLVAAYTNNIGTPPSAFKLYRFTDSSKSFAGLEELWMFPQEGMGGLSNSYRSAIPAVDVNGRIARIYVYTGENGYGMYEFKIAEEEQQSPVIVTSVSTLTGFNYLEGNGPSAVQSFTVSGTNLTNDITISASSDFEISTLNGSSFTPMSQIVLPKINGMLAEATIFVRLKAGFSVSSFVGTLTVNSLGAEVKNISLNGNVSANLSASPKVWMFGSNIVDFPIYSGVPANSSVNIQGLTIVAGPTTNMGQVEAYSTSFKGEGFIKRFKFNGAGWSGGTAINHFPSVMMPTQRYLRFSVNGASKITALGMTGNNAEERRLFVTDGTSLIGTMVFPVVVVSGTVTENSIIYEGTSTNLYIFGNASVNLFKLAVEEIRNPEIVVSEALLNGFGYDQGSGPSEVKSFMVSGNSLSGDITVISPERFEISTADEALFVPTQQIVLNQSSGSVGNTSIFVRLKAGLSAGIYSDSIVVSSADAQSVKVVLNGVVSREEDLSPTRTIEVFTPGTLVSLFTENEKAVITNLTVKGKIQWEEIGTIKQHIPKLAVLDLSGVSVDGEIIPPYQFMGNTSLNLDKLVLPSVITSIGSGAFRNCTGLKEVIIGNSLSVIANNAFDGCANLASIVIGSSVSTIGTSAFSNCYLLSNLVIANSVTSIEGNAFRNCSSISELKFGNALTNIGNSAFYGCSGIRKVTFGSSVATLGTSVFANCNGIKTIVFKGQNPPGFVGGGAFPYTLYSTATIFVPQGRTSAYMESVYWSNFENYAEVGLSTSTPTVYGLIYTPGNGPSKEKPVRLKGALLSGPISFYVPQNFEMSFMSGSGFVPVSSIAINIDEDLITDTVIYIRLKSGLSEKAYMDSLLVTTPGYSDLRIELQGAVRNIPDTVHVTHAGTLSSLLLPAEKANITKVVITGNIDARDMVCIRDEMPLLAELNMRNVMVKSYYGLDGTNETVLSYPENVFPQNSFFNYKNNLSKTSLKSIILPTSVTSIGHRAFYNCTALTKIVSLIATPPSMYEGSETFIGVPSSCSIRVPVGSVPAYKSVWGWSSFNVAEYKLKVETKTTGNVQQSSAVLNGSIDIIADSPVLSHGFCWNTTSNPTISDAKTDKGGKLIEGNFNDTISNLVYGTTYYVRAYATDAAGTVYGTEVAFTTPLPDHVKFIHVETAGTLGTLITNAERNVVTDLTVTGNIDVRDFKVMRDEIIGLTRLNLLQATIVSYTGSGGTCNDSVVCTYPANELPVYALGYNYLAAIPGNSSLKTVILPVNARYIGKGAFSGCFELSELTLSNELTTIGNQAFIGCKNLKSLLLPSSVRQIEGYAFAGCGFSNIIIPDSVTSIGTGAFSGCLSLESITIPDLVTEIAGYTFAGCKNLLDITLPVSVTRIGERAFEDCDKLTDIDFCENVTEIGKGAFNECDGFVNLVIPNAIVKIGDNAFEECSGIRSVALGSSLNSIGELVFMDSFGLSEFIVHPDNASFATSEGVLFNKNLTMLIDYPFDKQGDYIIPSSVNALGAYSFFMARNMKNVIIPGTVRNIGNAAFAYCLNLESITCESEIPVDLSSSEFVFSGINKNTCNLIVPAGSRTVYLAANQWSEFVNIEEQITTSLEQKSNHNKPGVLYDPVADCLRVTGIMEAALIEIFNLSGRLIMNAPVKEGLNSINVNNLADGVYFYRINHKDKISTGRFIKN